MSDSPFAVLGDVPGFFLGKRTKNCEKQLAAGIHRTDVFFLEDDPDSQAFELSGIKEAVLRVPRKPGNRFCDHQVDLPGFAVRDHPVESFTLLGVGSADTLIRIDVDHLVIWPSSNVFGVVIDLVFKGIKLLILVC